MSSGCEYPNCDGAKYGHIEVAKQAVRETFAILGVDIDNPKEVEDFRENLRFAGRVRGMANRGSMAIFLSLLTIITTGICGLIWKTITTVKGTHVP